MLALGSKRFCHKDITITWNVSKLKFGNIPSNCSPESKRNPLIFLIRGGYESILRKGFAFDTDV